MGENDLLAGVLAAILAAVATAGLANWLIVGIAIGLAVGLVVGFFTSISLKLPIIPYDELPLRLIGGFVSGLIIVVPAELMLWYTRILPLNLLVGLLVGLLIGFFIGLGGGSVSKLAGKLATWSLDSGIAHRSATSSGIDLADTINWSSRQAITGLAIGLPAVLLVALSVGLPMGLVVGLAAALLAGLRSGKVWK
jgi:hypothetical protein